MCCFLICLSLHAELLASLWNFLTRKIGNFSFNSILKHNAEQNIRNWLYPDHRDSSQSRTVKCSFKEGSKTIFQLSVSQYCFPSYLWSRDALLSWSVVWSVWSLGWEWCKQEEVDQVPSMIMLTDWSGAVGNTWLMLLLLVTTTVTTRDSVKHMINMTVAMVKLR